MTQVCAIVVSFHPDAFLIEALRVIESQVTHIVVIDNGSSAAELAALHHYQAQGERLTLIELAANKGLAYAQNRGIEWALERAFSHVLMLDQDSQPQEQMVERLLAASLSLTKAGHHVAVVGPQPIDAQSGRAFFLVRYGIFANQRLFCPKDSVACVLPVDFLIASGSLISREALNAIGLMDEAFFIDQIDTDWCLRASALGYQAYAVCDAVMMHSLGDTVIPLRLFNKQWHVSTHSPLRDYYLFRNTLWLFAKKTTHWRFIVINAKRLLLFFIFFGLFVPPRGVRIKMMLKGLWHGFKKSAYVDESDATV